MTRHAVSGNPIVEVILAWYLSGDEAAGFPDLLSPEVVTTE